MSQIEKLKSLISEQVRKILTEENKILPKTAIVWTAKDLKLKDGTTVKKGTEGKILVSDPEKPDTYIISIKNSDGNTIRTFATIKDIKLVDGTDAYKSNNQIVKEKVADLDAGIKPKKPIAIKKAPVKKEIKLKKSK